jgi:transcriptional regulator with XRE-family HTH domain
MKQNNQTVLEQEGQRLRKERKHLGLSQKELAAKVGLTREMWGRYERGLVQINRQVLAQFIALGARERVLSGEEALPAAVSADDVRGALAVLAGAMTPPLDGDELCLLSCFRVANPARRQILLAMACDPAKLGGGAVG